MEKNLLVTLPHFCPTTFIPYISVHCDKEMFLTLARSLATQCMGLMSIPYSVLTCKNFKGFLLMHRGRTILVITTKSSRAPDLQHY